MTLTAIKSDKNKVFLLSEQVKVLLHQKGFLKVFNYSDYNYFKVKAQHSYNKALAICEMFIQENSQVCESDFNDYIF